MLLNRVVHETMPLVPYHYPIIASVVSISLWPFLRAKDRNEIVRHRLDAFIPRYPCHFPLCHYHVAFSSTGSIVIDHDAQHRIADRFRGFLPVVVDVETAGFNAGTDALLEISAVLVTMDEHGYLSPGKQLSFDVHPFPGANLEKAALDFTGIDPDHPEREAVDEAEAITEVFRMIRREIKAQGCTRAILVGHNATFDHGFVKAAAQRIDAKRDPFHPFSSFDTASMAGLIYGQTVLAKACAMAGVEFHNSEAHSAAYDALRTAELFSAMVNRLRDHDVWPLHGD